MAESLGLVASVIQVAGPGVQLSKTLYEYVNGILTADRRIKDIAAEIKMTSVVIEELGDMFKQEEMAPLVSKKAVKTANETITECSALFAQIDATLKKSKKKTFGRLTMPFRDAKLELLRSHVDKLKSTLQLLMQVLKLAHQVASKKLDRAAEERQRKEIKQLLEQKEHSAKRHEDLLRKDSASDNNTLVVDDDEPRRDNGQSATPDLVVAASAVSSTITTESLAVCARHVSSLLKSIEILQQAFAAPAPGDDYSYHQQDLVDEYLHTRGHLDHIVLGKSRPTLAAWGYLYMRGSQPSQIDLPQQAAKKTQDPGNKGSEITMEDIFIVDGRINSTDTDASKSTCFAEPPSNGSRAVTDHSLAVRIHSLRSIDSLLATHTAATSWQLRSWKKRMLLLLSKKSGS
jgi:hypothetical protein